MSNSDKSYSDLTLELFGNSLSRDIRQVKLCSVYSKQSVYFDRCFESLLNVEYEYLHDLMQEIVKNKVAGAFVEFGIFQGAWINRLYQMTEQVGLQDREIYGFDSFKGLSKPHLEYDTTFWKEGMYAASKEEVEKNTRSSERKRIKFIEGFFSESLKTVQANQLQQVAFARIDCDIYEPAKQCLEYLSDRLSHGAILVFDDWAHDFEKGESKAFAEWRETVRYLEFKFLFLGAWDHLYLQVLHK